MMNAGPVVRAAMAAVIRIPLKRGCALLFPVRPIVSVSSTLPKRVVGTTVMCPKTSSAAIEILSAWSCKASKSGAAMNTSANQFLAKREAICNGRGLATARMRAITLQSLCRPARRIGGGKLLATVFTSCCNALARSLFAYAKTGARAILACLARQIQKHLATYLAGELNSWHSPLVTTANMRTSSGAAELVGGAVWIKAIVERLITDRANRNQSGALTHCHTSDSMYRANTRGRAPRIERLSVIDQITQAQFYSSMVRLFCQKEQRICQA